ncbi:T6SS effector amidase Tae4 family protein [Cupriavidus pinatubonensis]|uniref:T6SS effector amidase Tae4 family protein n=1 Tax=Cupriavidus pinatubonensis TaxID=248026 RepID=UPI00314502A8
MKSFSQKNVRPGRGKSTLGRILLDGKPTATRADEMAQWLCLKPFAGLPERPDVVTGPDWHDKVRGRTGIIFFGEYWQRHDESADAATGGAYRPVEWRHAHGKWHHRRLSQLSEIPCRHP